MQTYVQNQAKESLEHGPNIGSPMDVAGPDIGQANSNSEDEGEKSRHANGLPPAGHNSIAFDLTTSALNKEKEFRILFIS